MVDQSLDINEARLAEIQTEIKALEDNAIPLQDQQHEMALSLIQKVTEAWGIKLRQMFPDVQLTQDSCLAEVKPTDNLNKAPDLEKAVKDMGINVNRIEYDAKRNSYRIYGGTDAAPLAGSLPPV